MGYTGGTTPDPTYQAIGDHTEALRVEFDPTRVSYEELVLKFWREHDPMPFAMAGYQYRSAVWYHTPHQQAVVAAVKARLDDGSPSATRGRTRHRLPLRRSIAPRSTTRTSSSSRPEGSACSETATDLSLDSQLPTDDGNQGKLAAAKSRGTLACLKEPNAGRESYDDGMCPWFCVLEHLTPVACVYDLDIFYCPLLLLRAS